MRQFVIPALVLVLGVSVHLSPVQGQETPDSTTAPTAPSTPTPAPPVREVEVSPKAADEEIHARLQRILDATNWFEQPAVRVDEGVVFLAGTADTPVHRTWATDLAQRTEAVVAVVNQMTLAKPSVWESQPVRDGLDDLRRDSLRLLPFFALSLLILGLSVIFTRLAVHAARWFFRRRIAISLLREVVVYLVGFAVFLLGIYIVLRVSGLTRLALTVLGGTGILGLVIGIAFREITENFLASVFLSIQQPFRTGDFVEIDRFVGTVQAVTVRSTVMLTFDGIHVQIPNAVVYKSTIRNFTTHVNRREEVVVLVPHEAPLEKVQTALMQILVANPAVLPDPEPWVFVDQTTTHAIQLRLYYWIDTSQENSLRVRSSILRHAQNELKRLKVGFAVDRIQIQRLGSSPDDPWTVAGDGADGAMYTHAEGTAESESSQRARRAADVAPPELGTNLLPDRDERPVNE